MNKGILLLLIFLAATFDQAFAGTCALCKQSLAIGGTDGLTQGIYWSIVLIAGMPFLIFVTFFIAYHVGVRKRRKESAVPTSYHFDI